MGHFNLKYLVQSSQASTDLLRFWHICVLNTNQMGSRTPDYIKMLLCGNAEGTGEDESLLNLTKKTMFFASNNQIYLYMSLL